jgi:hypothetical protein
MTRPDSAHIKACDDAHCVICESWRDEMQQQALHHVLDMAKPTAGAQQTLDDY